MVGLHFDPLALRWDLIRRFGAVKYIGEKGDESIQRFEVLGAKTLMDVERSGLDLRMSLPCGSRANEHPV
jgi:hypothetical protein